MSVYVPQEEIRRPRWLQPYLPAKHISLAEHPWQAHHLFGLCREARINDVHEENGLVVFDLRRRRWEDDPSGKTSSPARLIVRGTRTTTGEWRRGCLFLFGAVEERGVVITLSGGACLTISGDKFGVALVE